MAISAKDVMTLRQRTGLGMMDCKKALQETDGDMDAAVELLRKELKGKMDERTDRAAGEGVIAVAGDDSSLAMVELDCETDFVARNEDFQAAGEKAAEIALKQPDGEIAANDEINSLIDDLRIKIQENISYARGMKLSGGSLGSYVHHNNKLAGVVKVEGAEVDGETLTGLCQHVVAHVPTPLAVDEAGLDEGLKEKAMSEAKEEAIQSGKPEEIAEKIATGKYRKWVDEHTLLGQNYVKDPEGKQTVGEALPKGAQVKCFYRYAVGAPVAAGE